jgi:hypothetical protein
MPPVIVFPVAFVINVLLPPGLLGVCSVPLIVSLPFKVRVEADKLTLAAAMVPLEFEFIVPLLTVIVFATDNVAFTLRVDAVRLPMVRDEQLALELTVG